MPDSLTPPANAVRPSGGISLLNDLMIDDSERRGLQQLADAHREHTRLIELAIERKTLVGAHACLMVGVRLGQIEAELSTMMGRR